MFFVQKYLFYNFWCFGGVFFIFCFGEIVDNRFYYRKQDKYLLRYRRCLEDLYLFIIYFCEYV